MIDIAASISLAFKSSIFASAIFLSWSLVIEATFSLCGSRDPEVMPIAFLIKYEAGAVFVTNVKELSSYIVISTGTVSPVSYTHLRAHET